MAKARSWRLAFLPAALALSIQPALASPIDGNWINPRGSVVVTVGDCRDKLCGSVSWANAEATSDATDAGVAHLIGTELLQDYRATGRGRWKGTVFVPDMGRSFSSTIEQLDADRLKISGCLIGGWFCKSQVWQRH